MYVRLRYTTLDGALQERLLAGVQLDTVGRLYEPQASGEWTPLGSLPFADQPEGVLLDEPLIEPSEGATLVCVLNGAELGRTRKGFRVLRGQDGDVDRLVEPASEVRPAYADWLAGEWMTEEGMGAGPRGERLLFLDARLVDTPGPISPGDRSRRSDLAEP